MQSLAQLFIELGINTAAFKTGLDKATYQAKQFAGELKDSLGDLGEGLKGLGESFGLLTPAMSQAVSGIVGALAPLKNSFGSVTGFAGGLTLAAAGVGATVLTMAAQSVEAANRMDELSQSTGIAVSTLSGLSKVAAIDGVGVEELAKGLEKMGKSAFAAASAAPTASNAYKTLGIEVTNANGGLKDQSALFTEVANKFATLQDGGAKAALAIQIFGRAGAELIPVLNRGGDNVNELVGHFQKMGAVLTDDTAAAASKLEENFALLQGGMAGVQNEILSGLAPAITTLTNSMVAGLEDKQSQLQAFVSGLVDMGKGVILTFQFAAAVIGALGIAIKGLFAELLLADDGLSAVGDKLSNLDWKGAKQAAGDAGRAIAEQAKQTAGEATDAWTNYSKNVVSTLTATNPTAKPHGGGGQDLQAKQANLDFISKTVDALQRQAAKEADLADAIGKVSVATINATAVAEANAAIGKIQDEAAQKGIQNTQKFKDALAQAIPKIQEAATWMAVFKAAIDTQTQFDAFDKKITEQIASLEGVATASSAVEREWAKNNATLKPLQDSLAQLNAEWTLLANNPGTDPNKLAKLGADIDRITNELGAETDNVNRLNIAFQNSKAAEQLQTINKATAELKAESDGLVAGDPYAKMKQSLENFIADYQLAGPAADKLRTALIGQEQEMAKIAALNAAKGGGFDPTQVAQLNNELVELKKLWDEGVLSETQYKLTLAQITAQQADLTAKSGGFIDGVRAGFADFNASIQSTGEVMQHAIGDGLKGISQDLAETIATGKADWQGLVTSMEEALLKSSINAIMQQLLGSLSTFLGGLSGSSNGFLSGIGDLFKAGGGSVNPGQSYIVGERGPEVFTPTGGGNITPNSQIQGMGGGTTVVQNWNITTPDADSFMRSRSQVQSEMYRAAAGAHQRQNG